MKRRKDITGQVFGRLTAVKWAGKDRTGKSMWWFACECGTVKKIRTSDVKGGRTKSCGCLMREVAKQIYTKHGLHSNPIYKVWKDMKQRCYNPNDSGYKDYGGRGIFIVEAWKTSPKTFIEWAIENGWKKGLTIDRIDNDKGYCPDNCRFTTMAEQARNRRTTKLSVENVKRIKALLLNSSLTHNKIAKMFNVSQSLISAINGGSKWKKAGGAIGQGLVEV